MAFGLLALLPMLMMRSMNAGGGAVQMYGNDHKPHIPLLESIGKIPQKNLRSLLGDVSSFLPAAPAGNLAKMAQMMDIAESIKDVREAPVNTQAVSVQNPIQRSMGLLNALKRNIPGMNIPMLSQIEQMSGAIQGIQSISKLGGLPNIMNTLSTLTSALPSTPQLPSKSSVEKAAESFTPQKAESLADSVNKALQGMDETQKRKLMDMARSLFAGN